MNPHKGYVGSIEYSTEDKCFHGRVLGIRDLISFEGRDLKELEAEFHASVDDYLAFCKSRGRKPEKPYSGKLPFRTTPEHHRLITQAAAANAKSINQWMDEVLAEAAKRQVRSGNLKIKVR